MTSDFIEIYMFDAFSYHYFNWFCSSFIIKLNACLTVLVYRFFLVLFLLFCVGIFIFSVFITVFNQMKIKNKIKFKYSFIGRIK